jgi:NAD+ synthase (glutamine-hydrolysing)
MKTLRIALAQINPTVGDIKGNSDKIIGYIEKAKTQNSDMVVFPELAITGYPPDDLLLNKNFIRDVQSSLDHIASNTTNIVTIAGFPHLLNNKLYNAAGIFADRKLIHAYHKRYLARSSVFDDTKYFDGGSFFPVFIFEGIDFQLLFGNEINQLGNEAASNINNAPSLFVCIDASCYCIDKIKEQEDIITSIALRYNRPAAYLNLVGGQDEWVFHGNSFIVDEEGRIAARCSLFEENLILFDIEPIDNLNTKTNHESGKISITAELKNKTEKIHNTTVNPIESLEEIYSALVLGTKDYVKKNGFDRVVLGLSGGIDSALAAVIAREALGEKHVTGVSMPTRFTSEESKTDAREAASSLNINFIEISIDKLYDDYLAMFGSIFETHPAAQLTKENIQPRIRANILMALSNNFGWLVLTTGNKSEVGTGYSTLYGDTAGAFAVIKDVPKTLVYELSRWINKKACRQMIPERILTKAPSAELKHDQKDTDTLPPYELLDPIIKGCIEDNKTIEELIAMGNDPALVKKIIAMIQKNEYKRRQSPIGIKITKKSFGRDMSFPITNRYRH